MLICLTIKSVQDNLTSKISLASKEIAETIYEIQVQRLWIFMDHVLTDTYGLIMKSSTDAQDTPCLRTTSFAVSIVHLVQYC